jgi:hypothetical protein
MSIHRTSLTRYAPQMQEPQLEDAREMARNTYLATGGKTVLINVEWLENWADKKQLDLLASKALRVKGLL